jgi:hypothetical protein
VATAAQYTGAWKRAVVGVPKVPLKPGADPAHAGNDTHTAADPSQGVAYWQQDTMVPAIPADWLGDQYTQLPTIHGVYDSTPQDHGHGLGVGHGESVAAVQAERVDWHGEELGATETRRYQPMNTREGTNNVVMVDDNANAGNSPGYPQTRYDRGVGVGSDPGARVGRRLFRWRDRTIDMHRWDPEGRAARARFAYSAPVQPAMPNGNQYVSEYPTQARFGEHGIGTPDQFVTPVERRSPREWGEMQTTDGYTAATDFGLRSWGL